jgi:hypothetical protein
VNIVLINQFFPPAQAPTGILLADLSAELARRGHAVTVIASAAGYGGESATVADMPSRMRVIRTGPSGRHRSGIAEKLGDYLSFYRGAWRELERLTETPDVLVCLTTPPFIGLLAAHLRKRRGIPYVLWCMDLYPEVLQANGFFRAWNPIKPLLRKLARVERTRASRVVALGPDMAGLLSASGASRIEEIPVWSTLAAPPEAQAAARELRRARGWGDGEIILLYSGNMGRAHRAEEFAALAERLRGRTPRCRVVFAGDGPLRTAGWEKSGPDFSSSWRRPPATSWPPICWPPTCIWSPSKPNGRESSCPASSRPLAPSGAPSSSRGRRKVPSAFGCRRPMRAGSCRRAIPPPSRRRPTASSMPPSAPGKPRMPRGCSIDGSRRPRIVIDWPN